MNGKWPSEQIKDYMNQWSVLWANKFTGNILANNEHNSAQSYLGWESNCILGQYPDLHKGLKQTLNHCKTSTGEASEASPVLKI